MKKSHDNHMKHTKEITPLRHLRNATGHQHVKRRRINDVITSDRQQNFSQDEEELIVKLHALLGNNRWSLIAGRLPGRTEEEVKKYWNSQLKEKLVSMGIDPNNHHVTQAICRPSSSSSCSCSLNHNHQTDDLDETTSSQHK